MRAAPAALDPANADAAPLVSLVFETLVRLDEAAAPQPCLAVSWQHDDAAKRWQFTLRPGVKLQDGAPLTAAAVAASLSAALPGVTVVATGDAVITIHANQPWPDLLLELAHNGWLSTGPFRPTAFEPGQPRHVRRQRETIGAAVRSWMRSMSNSAAACATNCWTWNWARPTWWK